MQPMRAHLDRNRPEAAGRHALAMDDAVRVLKMLLEGVSVRSTERLTGINRNTILDLLVLVGERAVSLRTPGFAASAASSSR